MGITVAVKVDHLPTAFNAPVPSPASDKLRTILVPNVDYHGTVRATLNAFIRQNLFIPERLQLLSAPLFTKLSEKDSVEDIYTRYACQAELEVSELHLDEDTFMMYGREGGRFVDLVDEKRLDDYHILDRSTLQLKRLPNQLPDIGGRIFVETKDGVLPLLGVTPLTPVAAIKHALEGLTGIPVAQQLLSSVGRVMHDEFLVNDYDGLHMVYEDSILDLSKSEDTNVEQAHRRMVVFVNLMGEEEFTFVVQGRDSVLSLLKLVESRTGIAPWQQRITYSGKVLQEKKTLGSYFVQPESTLNVTMFKSPIKPPSKPTNTTEAKGLGEAATGMKPGARKLKLMRTSKGHVKATLTIPVLTTDTVADLKRKLKRTLQPLGDRNFGSASPAKDHIHNELSQNSVEPTSDTFVKTPVSTPPTESQKMEQTQKEDSNREKSQHPPGHGRSLSFSKLLSRSPSTQSPVQNPQVFSSPANYAVAPSPQKPTLLYTPQHAPLEAPFSPRGAKSGPLPMRKALDELPMGPSTAAPTSARRLNFESNASSSRGGNSDMSQSSCRDLMPELLSLPDADPKVYRIHDVVRENPPSLAPHVYGDENNFKGRLSGMGSNMEKKFGAISNIDKKAVKQWFSTGMESLKEHIRVLAVDS